MPLVILLVVVIIWRGYLGTHILQYTLMNINIHNVSLHDSCCDLKELITSSPTSFCKITEVERICFSVIFTSLIIIHFMYFYKYFNYSLYNLQCFY